ncbi:uncharacterized protein BCR38DRAFT_487260 [Pseudomassariella vexata]|uniref:Uncharacterized protein n=1 Tax=Pseudomassariella vexata TaxID=1141098 RepID=A0A1Y2DQL5_9PEZI|nr:uncharacterized protein BCR38DRAFT_487260 [Pseudomassariella vexata]ORY61507.1 hypothetical protein BCR38DRAFT_487260 [Pseudomassariella vexata]
MIILGSQQPCAVPDPQRSADVNQLSRDLNELPVYLLAIVNEFDQYVWCFIEINVGIICAPVCTPRPFFRGHLHTLSDRSTSEPSNGGWATSNKKCRTGDCASIYQLGSRDHQAVGSRNPSRFLEPQDVVIFVGAVDMSEQRIIVGVKRVLAAMVVTHRRDSFRTLTPVVIYSRLDII